MRVNLSLNKNNSKDERIIKFLESKYNESAYIKEVLYQLSYGGIQEFGVSIGNRTDSSKEITGVEEEVFDEIIGVDEIII